MKSSDIVVGVKAVVVAPKKRTPRIDAWSDSGFHLGKGGFLPVGTVFEIIRKPKRLSGTACKIVRIRFGLEEDEVYLVDVVRMGKII